MEAMWIPVNQEEYLEAIYRFLREENVSQSAFARRLGTSRQYINRAIKSGRASQQLLDRLTGEINSLAVERTRPERFRYNVEFNGEIMEESRTPPE